MSDSLPLVHHNGYTIALPASHPFPMAKFRVLQALLESEGIADGGNVRVPPAATAEELELVHGAAYVSAFMNGRVDASAQRRTGFRWSPALAQRTLLEVGGTVETVALALRHGLACNTAGGTHHAFPDHGSGYCLLNDIAVAAAVALERGWARRVLVVDLDVHQGDGTAFMFRDEPAVFTLSFHGAGNFPARKQSSDLDVALPSGTADDDYLAELEATLPRVLAEYTPDLVIYDAGVDVHADDRLGHLALSDDGLRRRDGFVLAHCLGAGVPVAAVIGGGYDRDMAALCHRHAFLHREARRLWHEGAAEGVTIGGMASPYSKAASAALEGQ